VKYKHIPRTDLYPSVICLGTVSFGTTLDISNAFQLLDTFFECGGNFIDTAHIYGAWDPDGLGRSEKIIGHWVKERGVEENIIIATKGAHPLLSAMQIPRLSRQNILIDLDESLRCLQRDAIDLYWLHRDDPKRPVADILETLNSQVTQGKIRYFGCSNRRVERIEEAMCYATGHGLAGFVGNQCMWSFAVPNRDTIEDSTIATMDAQTFEFHRKTGLAIVAYTSQAHGFFSKASNNPTALEERLRKMYSNQENTERLHRLQRVSEEVSLSISAISLAYLTNQPFPTFPIAGFTNVQQLLESIKAGDAELSFETIQYLEKGE
jgi:aryl-alcohol dehydrogenase-like predicted oxidoreductase